MQSPTDCHIVATIERNFVILIIFLAIITASDPTIISGADLADWRNMGRNATNSELAEFIESYPDSTLAELAYRRLDAPPESAPENVERAISAHNVQLVREVTSIAVAPLTPELSNTVTSTTPSVDSAIADAQ